jgi:hypothetical protein
VPDYIALNPYLRRYDLTPEQQQQAYDRYVLANAQVGTGAGTTDADMRPNAVSLAMNPVLPDAAPSEMNSTPPAPRDVQLAGAGEPSPPTASDSAGNGMPPVSVTPATDTPAEPDRRSLETIFGYPNYTPMPSAGLPRPASNYTPMPDAGLPRPAPNYTPMPGSLPTRLIPDKPAKIDEARKVGYPASQIVDFLARSDPNIQIARAAGSKDEEILNRLAPPPSLGRRALDTVADAGDAAWRGVNTAINYAGTQSVNAASGLLGLPRATADAVSWLSNRTGLPPWAFGPVGSSAFAVRNMPTSDEISRAFFDATGAPEVKLEGAVPGGKIIDAGVQGTLSVPMMGASSVPALMAGAFGGAGDGSGGPDRAQVRRGPRYELGRTGTRLWRSHRTQAGASMTNTTRGNAIAGPILAGGTNRSLSGA